MSQLVSYNNLEDKQISERMKGYRQEIYARLSDRYSSLGSKNDDILDIVGLGAFAGLVASSSDTVLGDVVKGLMVTTAAVVAPFSVGAVASHFAFRGDAKEDLINGVPEEESRKKISRKGGLFGGLVVGGLIAIGTAAAALAWPVILAGALCGALVGAFGGWYRGRNIAKNEYIRFENKLHEASQPAFGNISLLVSKDKTFANYQEVEKSFAKYKTGVVSKEELLKTFNAYDAVNDHKKGPNLLEQQAAIADEKAKQKQTQTTQGKTEKSAIKLDAEPRPSLLDRIIAENEAEKTEARVLH